MGRKIRERIVGELTERYKNTQHAVFFDFNGLSVEAASELRRNMADQGMEMFIAKNSLLKLALKNAGLEVKEDLLVKPTAIITGSGDPVAVCKFIVEWQKKNKIVAVKGGLLDGKALTGRQVEALSKTPPRQVLLSQILGLFIMPLTDVANLLNNTIAQFANLVNNHIDKVDKAEKVEDKKVENVENVEKVEAKG